MGGEGKPMHIFGRRIIPSREFLTVILIAIVIGGAPLLAYYSTKAHSAPRIIFILLLSWVTVLGLGMPEAEKPLLAMAWISLLMGSSNIQYAAEIGIMARWFFMALLAVRGVLWALKRQSSPPLTPTHVILGIFVLYAILSSTYSIEPTLTLQRAISVALLWFSLFWSVWHYASDLQKIRGVIYVLGYVFSSFLLLSDFSLALGWPQAFDGGRFRGIMANANSVGSMSALGISLFLLGLVTSQTMAKSISYSVLLCLTIVNVILSGSRAGAVATSAATAIVLAVGSKRKSLLVTLALSLGVIILMLPTPSLSAVVGKDVLIRFQELPFLHNRRLFWEVAISVFMRRPLYGHGFGVTERILKLHAQNSFLNICIDLGAIGLFITVVLLGTLVFEAGQLVSRLKDRETKLLAAALVGVLVGGLADASLESWLTAAGSFESLPFWLAGALILRMNYLLNPAQGEERIA